MITPVNSSIESIELKLGNISFSVTNKFAALDQTLIELFDYVLNIDLLSSIDLLNFKSTQSQLWVSVFALDDKNFEENFIKIGFGYVLDENVVIKYFAKSKEGVNFLKSISKVEIDKRVNVIEQICFIKPLIKDLNATLYDPGPTIRIDGLEILNENLFTKYNLPDQGNLNLILHFVLIVQ